MRNCPWFWNEQEDGKEKSSGRLPQERQVLQWLREQQKPESNSEIGMNLKKVLLELSVQDVQEILAIDLDRDQEKALSFIREKLAKQVKKALQSH
jgi:hypothetical protein